MPCHVSSPSTSNAACGFPCIRLSDKTSRLHPRHVAPKPGQTHEPAGLVEVREWIAAALASSGLVVQGQPPTQPHRCVAIDSYHVPWRHLSAIRSVFSFGANTKLEAGGRIVCPGNGHAIVCVGPNDMTEPPMPEILAYEREIRLEWKSGWDPEWV